jgi:hypothetical protein
MLHFIENIHKMTNREKVAYEDGSAKRKYIPFEYMMKKILNMFFCKKEDANLSSSRLLCQHRGRSHPASRDTKLPLKYHISLLELLELHISTIAKEPKVRPQNR